MRYKERDIMEHYKASHHTHSKLERNRAITEWRKRDRETETQYKRDVCTGAI